MAVRVGRGGLVMSAMEQRGETPLELLTLIHDLLPPRCESHMFGGGLKPPPQ